jgi:hypothetical protein
MLEIRCLCDEAGADTASAAAALAAASRVVESFQLRQRRRVNAYVDSVLPPGGLRARLFAAARAKTEARNAAALRELNARAASTRERYEMLWDQQWARRQSLVSLASISESSGVLRFLASYVARVPAPVLELAREINSETGPTAHLRALFGDSLQDLVLMAARIRAASATLASCHASLSASQSSLAARSLAADAEFALRDAALAFAQDVAEFVTALDHAVAASPLLEIPQPQPGQVAHVAAAAAAAASATTAAAAAAAAASGPSK